MRRVPAGPLSAQPTVRRIGAYTAVTQSNYGADELLPSAWPGMSMATPWPCLRHAMPATAEIFMEGFMGMTGPAPPLPRGEALVRLSSAQKD
jgi:hypothetical protein